MSNQKKYIMQSLELHLFFARIMKEHSLFLEAAFTPPDIAFAKKADWFKVQFENILSNVVRLSRGAVRSCVLDSGEIVTQYTLKAEKQTEQFTGIEINTSITEEQTDLCHLSDTDEINCRMAEKVMSINRSALRLLNGLIEFKERILSEVRCCRMFTMNYPLLIEHILREAKLYRASLISVENGTFSDCCMKDTEDFWNRIMMEHAMFIRGLLDPCEAELIDTADSFAEDYAKLLKEAQTKNDRVCSDLTASALEETLRFRDFKEAGTSGIQNCEIESVILPLLADHVLREANHYIRLLETVH